MFNNDFKTKLFIDGPDLLNLQNLNKRSLVCGFTTNPTLISKMNIPYETYSKKFLKIVKKKSSSFEVLGDDNKTMIKEAVAISKWGRNVFVKIPIVNTKGKSTGTVIKHLSNLDIKLNVTAIFTKQQIDIIKKNINNNSDVIISIFCGRIADTGRDPIEYVKYAKKTFRYNKNVKILWASPREILNIFHANNSGCDFITITEDLFKKLSNLNKNLHQFSIETVKMFFRDAKKSNLKINVT